MSAQRPSEDNRRQRVEKAEYARNISREAKLQQQKAQAEQRWRQRRRRRFTAYTLFALAGIVALSHVLTHAGAFTIIANKGLADLIIGYPTAGVLAVAGLVLLPAQRY